MYRYDEFDAAFVNQRVAQFRDQVDRRISGELNEDEFKPLRLMNGVYLQLHAYMLRIAIPYGTLSSRQLDKLALIADQYDKGYGHFTTRQNIQFNWIRLDEVADVLDHLAEVEMHAIQTSGNCIRNVTSDVWAGVAADEVLDPRPYAEFIRQWSSIHPEFSFLPRKFKIAVSASEKDRAAIMFHDMGLRIRLAEGDPVFDIFVGGGQGRTPKIAKLLREGVPFAELLTYMQAIMRVYNEYGRRDNMYKARIKILVQEVGVDALREQIDASFESTRNQSQHAQVEALEQAEIDRILKYFATPQYDVLSQEQIAQAKADIQTEISSDAAFAAWYESNCAVHKQAGYQIVNVSTKPKGGIPGDASSDQMRALAAIARQYSMDEIRISHRQNVSFPYVKLTDVIAVWKALQSADLTAANYENASDMICCPGLDYCALATARSIPVAQRISQLLSQELERVTGQMHINISGCINACGHHHVGNIGILGMNKAGREYFQFAVGGNSGYDASIAERLGPGLSEEDVPAAVNRLIETYLALRQSDSELFIDTFRREGSEPFKEALYAIH